MWQGFKTGQVGFATKMKPGKPMNETVMPTGKAVLRETYFRNSIPAEYPTLAGRRRPPGS